LLASLSHICKNRDKNTQCFNVSLKKSLKPSNLIFNIVLMSLLIRHWNHLTLFSILVSMI
jgi:hypothetical protein